jgi:DNA-binding transcriptional ArsR family regulator
MLAEDEMSVNEIAESVGTSIQNTSQHLRLMKDKEIVESRRNGKEIYYRVAENDVGVYCKKIVSKNSYHIF